MCLLHTHAEEDERDTMSGPTPFTVHNICFPGTMANMNLGHIIIENTISSNVQKPK